MLLEDPKNSVSKQRVRRRAGGGARNIWWPAWVSVNHCDLSEIITSYLPHSRSLQEQSSWKTETEEHTPRAGHFYLPKYKVFMLYAHKESISLAQHL